MPSFADLQWERQRRLYRGADGDPLSQLAGFEAFCRDHVIIKHPRDGRIPFLLRDAQRATALSYLTNDQTLILKARQIGFTTTSMIFCLWRVLFFEDFDIIILSRRESDAMKALAMCDLAYNQIAPEVRRRLPRRLDNNKAQMSFANHSSIESHPSANNPARGRTARLMMLDEWAFMPNPDDAWAAVEPATDIGGQIIALSTANGWGNLFHEMWIGASTGDNDFHPIFYPWSAVPERDAAWYERKKRAMPGWQLAQEYPSSPEEAFIKSGRTVFDVDLVAGITTRKPRVGDLMDPERRTPAPPRGRRFVDMPERDRPPLSLYELPIAGQRYVIGADVAEGLDHGDFSSAHVIRLATGGVVAHYHDHIDPDLFGGELAALGWFYNEALLGVEVNNHGLTTLKAVQRLRYPRIYMRRRYGSRRERVTEELGWHTNSSTKPMMIDELNGALRDDSLILKDEPTRQELLTYVRDDKGHMSGSPFDDRVMSLALANQMRKHAFEHPESADSTFTPGTFGWELQRLRRLEAEQARQDPLGAYNVRRPA